MSAEASKASQTHTPGPWRVSWAGSEPPGNYLLHQAKRETNARVHDANARLIAAAPELAAELEATDITLTNMLQVFGEHAISDAARAKVKITRDRIRALLARIDGTDRS